MITLTATINVLEATGQTLSGATSNLPKNNISSNLSTIVGSTKQSIAPFILGSSKLGNGRWYCSSIDYFMGSQLSNSSGVFTNPYVITISGSNIDNFSIVFDKENGEYPTSIIVDGDTYTDDDSTYNIGSLTSASSHTITINNWNKANSPLVITGLYIGLFVNIDNKNMLEISRTISDRADYKMPSYGIISNTGNIRFNDLYGEIKEYAENLLLKANQNVTINIKDTLTEKTQQIGKFITDIWNYDNDNFEVNVSLKDDLVEWQDIKVDGFGVKSAMTMKDYYDYLVSKTPLKWTFNTLDATTNALLQSISCAYPYLVTGSLWTQWQKLCEVAMLHIYKDNDGIVVVKYTGA